MNVNLYSLLQHEITIESSGDTKMDKFKSLITFIRESSHKWCTSNFSHLWLFTQASQWEIGKPRVNQSQRQTALSTPCRSKNLSVVLEIGKREVPNSEAWKLTVLRKNISYKITKKIAVMCWNIPIRSWSVWWYIRFRCISVELVKWEASVYEIVLSIKSARVSERT